MADLQFQQPQPNYAQNAANFYSPLLNAVPQGGDWQSNILRALGLSQIAGAVNMPALKAAGAAGQPSLPEALMSPLNPLNTLARGYSAVKAYNAPPAAPAAPAGPQPQLAATPQVPSVPRLASTTHSLPDTGTTFNLGQFPTLPTPPAARSVDIPQLPGAPQVSAPQLPGIPGYDFTEYKKLLDKAGVSSSENMANVLGGLAGGAAGVSATEPGSFAKALAAAGAGGMQGYKQTQLAAREDAQRRAAAELQMLSMQHSASKDSADLAYKGAELQYHASVNNALLQQQQVLKQAELTQAGQRTNTELGTQADVRGYEAGLKKAELQLPKVSHDANGVTVQQVMPDGQIQATYHPTKSIIDKAENMKNIIEATTKNGPVAEGFEMQLLMNHFKDNPQLAQGALVQLAVRRTIGAGAGQSVFGQAYELAAKNAAKQLNIENPTLQTKPELFQATLNDRIVSTLLNDPRVNQLGWLHSAAPHSMAARVLSEAMSGGGPAQ